MRLPDGATVVVDVGCAPHGDDVSILPLIRRFKPDAFYGFDPAIGYPTETVIDGTPVRLSPRAAWTSDGTIEFAPAGIVGTVIRTRNQRGEWDEPSVVVPCFDLASFLMALPIERGVKVVLKLDVEGAEYALLRHLIFCEIDQWLELLLVEWHDVPGGIEGDRYLIESALHCPVEPW